MPLKSSLAGFFCFRKNYFLIALLLFITEVFIALYVRDRIIRPYGGDFLVIGFLYCLCRSFFRLSVEKAIVPVLLFAFAIESLQLFRISEAFNFQEHQWLQIVLGSQFEWLDMLVYCLGAVVMLLVEHGRSRKTRYL